MVNFYGRTFNEIVPGQRVGYDVNDQYHNIYYSVIERLLLLDESNQR